MTDEETKKLLFLAAMGPAPLAHIRKIAEASTDGELKAGPLEYSDADQLFAELREVFGRGIGPHIWMAHDGGRRFVAITGNGPDSAVNAMFFAIARRSVLATLDRISDLDADLATARRERTDAEAETDRLTAVAETMEKRQREIEADFAAHEQGLEAKLADVTKERDEARGWVRTLTATERVLTCVYCGHAYPPGSPDHGAEVLTAHVAVCEKHPMRAVVVERDRYKLAFEKLDAAVKAYVEMHGLEHQHVYGDSEIAECPQDDTCGCPLVAAIELALAHPTGLDPRVVARLEAVVASKGGV